MGCRILFCRAPLCVSQLVPHRHSIMCHVCICRRMLGLPCMALPAEPARPQNEKGALSCVLRNIHRGQEAFAEKNEVLENKAFNDNPPRLNQLQFVKSFVVHAVCPFNIAEHARMRRYLSLLCPKKLRVDGFNTKAVSTTCAILYYLNVSSMLQRLVCVPFGCFIPWIPPFLIGY